MGKLEKIYENSGDFQGFCRGYFDYLSKLMASLDAEQIQTFVEVLESAQHENKTVFIVGNGGSASTAQHMANDLIHRRTGGQAIKAIALVDNPAVLSAISNDKGYEHLFVAQLEVLFSPGDKLIAISASGNSPNVIAAAEWVRAQDGTVVALVGFDGGKLKQLADVVIQIKADKGEYGPVEDIHMILDHLIYSWFCLKIQFTDQKLLSTRR